MRRPHRSAHFLIWLALVPVITVIAFAALKHKPEPATNDSLPAGLVEEME